VFPFELYKCRDSIKTSQIISRLFIRLLWVVLLRKEHEDAKEGKDQRVHEVQVPNSSYYDKTRNKS
jgi:hypothetical protein